jgi:5'-nucleotidase
MTEGMPQILVTNDDGVDADGLRALAEGLTALGDVIVVAPAKESSAVGHALTVRRPLTLREVGVAWYSVDGTPTDCVNVAVSELLGQVPALVVSGINNGLNVGDDVTYSGTVAGALEGILLGAPALAVSLQRSAEPMDYAPATAVAVQLAHVVLDQGLPRRTLLNVNVPRGAPGGLRVTVQATRTQTVGTHQLPGAGGQSSVWIGSADLKWEPNDFSDYDAIQAGFVSVTPLHPDWTNHAALDLVETLTAPAPAEVE